jgi:Flp pilus assembly protein TadG
MLDRRRGLAATLAERKSVVALEFAIVAPILLTLSLATFDIARALLIWQQINNAAEAVVEGAEKLSVTQLPNGSVASSLTPVQMQTVMTTVYAQIPGLNLAIPTGAAYPGSFSVTLSSVAFTPLCPNPQTGAVCTPAQIQQQAPVLIWSSYLTKGGGNGTSLNANPNPNPPLRPCPDQTSPGAGGPGLQPVVQLTNSVPLEYAQMNDPDLVPGAAQIIRVPQLVADVQYSFTPAFAPFSKLFFKNLTFVATATLPAPIGSTNQQTTLNAPAGTYNESTNPRSCS